MSKTKSPENPHKEKFTWSGDQIEILPKKPEPKK